MYASFTAPKSILRTSATSCIANVFVFCIFFFHQRIHGAQHNRWQLGFPAVSNLHAVNAQCVCYIFTVLDRDQQ